MSQDTAALNKELDKMIARGQGMEAFEKFYADDVVMQENSEEPRRGKETNREFEKQFFSSIEEFHGAELLGSAASGDRSYSEWTMDATFKGGGRVQMSEVAVRQWKGGKVAFEHFYYNKG